MSGKDEIVVLMARYAKAHHDGDGELIAAMFLDDAVIIPPDRPRHHGRAAIDEFFSGISGNSNMKTESAEIEINRNLAYVHGETSLLSEGEPCQLRFVNILRLIDGEWRFQLLIWNVSSKTS